MTDPRRMGTTGIWVDEHTGSPIQILRDTHAEHRRTLRKARRVLGAALAQRNVDPELVAAAQMIIEAGERR
jgi:hypothetical protein